MGFLFVFFLFMLVIFYCPNLFSDAENFNPANPIITPVHIQPEWYFLFAYAILRSIPNKLGGAIALVASILILSLVSISHSSTLSFKFRPYSKVIFWFIVRVFIILTWIGANPVESPLLEIGQFFRGIYFILFICLLV